MKRTPRTARWQLERFLSSLFLSNELVELRFIESWQSRGKKRSRVTQCSWFTRPGNVVSDYDDLTAYARHSRANVYFGVCPRRREGDRDDQSIDTIRCVWCDIDDVTVEEAKRRWATANVPRPSVVVNSGSGIHGYWLLERDLQSSADRSRFSTMLPYFYKSFGGDHVQNLSRVLRVPGTVNYKNARNGRPPLPCTLCSCDPDLRYPLEAFSQWIKQAEQEQCGKEATESTRHTLRPFGDERSLQEADVRALVDRLKRPSRDRSRRDFAIVCDLLRLGLSTEQIWELVSETSKFKSGGRPYFDVTVANAQRMVFLDGMAPPKARASP